MQLDMIDTINMIANVIAIIQNITYPPHNLLADLSHHSQIV